MKIKLIDGSYKEIALTPGLQQHFADAHNYTREIMAQFEDSIYRDYLTKPGSVVLDIGANVGLFALHVSPLASRIVCVEPTPEHMARQKELIPEAEHEQAALSDHTGKTKFYWCGVNTTMNSLQDRFDRSFDVDCITLPDLLDKYNLSKVDFCKIDIEGSEHTAITRDIIRQCYDRIDNIFMEVHPPNGETQDKFKAIFQDAGYQVVKIIHDTLFCQK